MAHIFISYARTNRNYALRIKDTLEEAGIETWVDLENLNPGSVWQPEIEAAIDGCFAFVYLLSKESIASEYCQKEFHYALEEKKKIIPIRLPGISDRDVPSEISAFQWMTWEDFEEGLSTPDKLFKRIQMDLNWAKFHADLMVKAKKWESNKTNTDLLLRGKEIREAERQIDVEQEYPKTTSLQFAYLLQSKKHEVKLRRRIITGIGFVLLTIILLALFAFKQQEVATSEGKRADEQESIKLANRLSNEANSLYLKEPGSQLLPVLLAVQAMQIYPVADAAEILLNQKLAQLQVRFINENSVSSMSLSQDGNFIIYGDTEGIVQTWNLDAGEKVSEYNHEGEINVVAFHPNGKWVASGGSDNIIELWDFSSGREIDIFYHDGSINALDFDGNGDRIVSGSSDGTGRVWDVRTGKRFHASLMAAS